MPGRTPSTADLLVRAGRIHTMNPTDGPLRAIAVMGDSIVALSATAHGLDDLVGPATPVVDDPALTVLPAFNDTHNHLLEAARNDTFVQVNQAHSVDEFVALIRERAAHTPKGRWIQTSNAWHERQLVERRLPTAADL